MAIITSNLFEYMEDSTFFGQSDAKADRTKISIINRSLQYGYANSQLKNVEEYGRIMTASQFTNVGGVIATSGGVDLTFTSEIFTSGDSALSGQYISIGSSDRLYLIEDIPSTSGLTLRADYPYIGSGETSGLYRINFPVAELPSGTEIIDDPKNEFYLDSLSYIDPQEWLNLVRNVALTNTTPQYFTLMDNQVTNKLSLFFWPSPNENLSIDFRYWRYPATVNNNVDEVDWPENDLWVLQSIIDYFSMQYVNFGEDAEARIRWYSIKKKEAFIALRRMQQKNFHRVDLGYIGMSSNEGDPLLCDLRRFPSNP